MHAPVTSTPRTTMHSKFAISLNAAVLGATLLTTAVVGHAQTYPTRTIRMIIPYAAGGGSDINARMISQKLSDSLGHPVVVDNRVGAGGNVGTDAIAKAAPDGYTIGIATPGPVTVGKSLYPNLPYDPERDLVPVILMNESPLVLVIHPAIQARTVNELIALAKAKPGAMSAALPSTGSVQHLLTEMLKDVAKVNIVDIPYKGAEPAANELAGGQVDIMWSVLPTVMPFIKPGKLRVLAVASDKRTPALPDVPTMRESGWPTVIGSNWNGVIAPAGTPKSIIDRLNVEIGRILTLPDVKERYATLDVTAIGGSADAFRSYMKAEAERWSAVIRKANIKVD